MQDRYAGDVGDFGKFSLLQALQQDVGGRLGIVWYAVGDESHNADGRHITYRHKHSFRNLNDPLLQELSEVLDSKRSIAALEKKLSLLSGAALHSELVPQREKDRGIWLNNAIARMRGCGVVFLDPDNGISSNSVCGVKHAGWEEIDKFLAKAQLLMIYHHPGRNGSHNAQIRTLLDRLAENPRVKGAFALRFRRGTSRAFLVASISKATYQRALAAVEGFLQQGWLERGHFDEIMSAGIGD
jgi:hypothetical protein